MSKVTKRKHVVQEVLEDYSLPEGHQQIVKVSAGRGNNLHEVETADNEKYLVTMPTKFRKNVWIKRGDYVVVEPISEGDKVKAEIVTILYKDQIKYIKEEGQWPAGFTSVMDVKSKNIIPDDMLPPSDDSGDEGLGDMVVNTNRPTVVYVETDSSEEDEEEEEETEECGK